MSDKKILFDSISRMPPMAVSLASMDWNKTGSWRYLRPMYQYKTAPCIPACPAGEKVPRYLRELVKEEPNNAWATIIKDNPFPSVCGRVCRYPCEAACNRRRFDSSISIRALERYIGDYGRTHGKFEPVILDRKKKVAVVGSGLAGLTCAFNLRLQGYRVDVFEAMDRPGGAVRYRIHSFRLPEDVLDDEIDLIRRIGVNISTGVRIGKDKEFEELLAYDAVFISTGAREERSPGIAGEDLEGVHTSGAFLLRVTENQKPNVGPTVAVLGSDEEAIDSARTLLRLGKKVSVLGPVSGAGVSVTTVELEDALREGVELKQMTRVTRVLGEDGRVNRIEYVDVTPGKPDASGRRKLIAVEGSGKGLEVTGVISSTGAVPVYDFLPESMWGDGGEIIVDDNGRTSIEKVFMGGDSLPVASRTVIDAIGSGKGAAVVIGAYLQEKPLTVAKSKREIVHYETLNHLYFRKAERPLRKITGHDKAVDSFEECELGMDEKTAREEAERCMSCGVCTECDNCLVFCPDVAISKLKKGYRINYDYCKGCGICVHECPRNCMSLVEELKWKK